MLVNVANAAKKAKDAAASTSSTLPTKKKSRKVPVKKPAPKLEKVFDCPFCNHTQCIEIRM